MKIKIFAIKDLAAQAFLQPFFTHSSGVANRSFTSEINNAQQELFKHYQDLELYELGEFDDFTGRIQSYDDPKLISRGSDVKIPAQAA